MWGTVARVTVRVVTGQRRLAHSISRRIPILPLGSDQAGGCSPHVRAASVIYVPLVADGGSGGGAAQDGSAASADLRAAVPPELEFLEINAVPPSQRDDLARALRTSGGTAFLHPTGSGRNTTVLSRVLAVGLGTTLADATPGVIRDATAAAVTALRAADIVAADFYAPNAGDDPVVLAAEVARSVMLADYRFDAHLSDDKAATRLDTAVLALCPLLDADGAQVDAAETKIKALLAVGAGTNFARDLVNRRGDECTPAHMETASRELAEQYGFKFTCLQADELAEEGLRLLLAVGQAATELPRLVTLECDDLGGDAGTLVVVGKGVTFDTGGLNLKPTGSIEGMHMDMGGAAAVLGAARAVGELRQAAAVAGSAAPLSRYSKVVFCVALAENAVGPLSFKPHEIVRSHSGQTVSVGNTDAEGRLCLADALSWSQQRFGPNIAGVVDLATLTGACVVALGEYAAGVFTNNAGADLVAALQASGSAHGEVLHPLPILPGHRKEITEHDHADLCSTGATRWGGACTAAAFLECFVDKATPWAHIDIAGPAMTSAERGVVPKGGTGFGAATITELIIHQPRGE
jgi:leucyl aminopeptidase